ncbi:MAG: biotin/lipoyl-containing protein [Bacteroidota bacterium]
MSFIEKIFSVFLGKKTFPSWFTEASHTISEQEKRIQDQLQNQFPGKTFTCMMMPPLNWKKANERYQIAYQYIEGDRVKKGQVFARLTTKFASMELQTKARGYIVFQAYQDQPIQAGDLVMILCDDFLSRKEVEACIQDH